MRARVVAKVAVKAVRAKVKSLVALMITPVGMTTLTALNSRQPIRWLRNA